MRRPLLTFLLTLLPARLLATGLIAGAAVGPAAADTGGCGGGPVLGTHLHYRSHTWSIGADPDDGGLGIDAPRHWSFTRTSSGQGRFQDPTHEFLLSLGPAAAHGSPRRQMHNEVGLLQGTTGLRILSQRVHVDQATDQRWATLTYRWSQSHMPRRVTVRWIAFGARAGGPALLQLTVAARPMDRAGMRALLAHATATAVLAG